MFVFKDLIRCTESLSQLCIIISYHTRSELYSTTCVAFHTRGRIPVMVLIPVCKVFVKSLVFQLSNLFNITRSLLFRELIIARVIIPLDFQLSLACHGCRSSVCRSIYVFVSNFSEMNISLSELSQQTSRFNDFYFRKEGACAPSRKPSLSVTNNIVEHIGKPSFFHKKPLTCLAKHVVPFYLLFSHNFS